MLVKLTKNRGFTLIELAIVMFIVGLLLAGILTPISVQIEQEGRAKTSDIMDDIEESLMGFAVINGRLPCPDCPDGNVGTCSAVAVALRNDGIEDTYTSGSDNICRSDVGNLPWVDLHVPEYDAWTRHYTYRVTSGFADDADGTGCGTPAVGVSFEICSSGDIDIYNTYDTDYNATYGNQGNVADNVAAILISHGKNHFESTQTDQEVENYDRDPVNPDTGLDILSSYTAANYTSKAFIYTGYETSSSGAIEYDDLMIWISPNVLMSKMIDAGKLP